MAVEPMVEEGSRRGLDQILVSEAMHPGVLTCALDTPLRDVARMMAAYRIHAVVVYGGEEESSIEGRLWGVVSDLDLVAAAAAGEIEERTAGVTAVTPVVMIGPEDTLAHAAQLMSEHEVSHLVVLDAKTAHPVGVLSTLDIAKTLALGAR